MIIDWDSKRIIAELRRCNAAMVDPHETGFVQWPCKQTLYKVKFALDAMIEDAPTFAGEEEWLAEQEKQQVWKKLNE